MNYGNFRNFKNFSDVLSFRNVGNYRNILNFRNFLPFNNTPQLTFLRWTLQLSLSLFIMHPFQTPICCQNPNQTTTQPNKLGLTRKWLYTTTHHHPPPPTPPTPQTQCRQYLSCYWPDFDETLKVASLEHLEQIPSIKLTFVQATFVLATIVHIRNISAVTDLILMKL